MKHLLNNLSNEEKNNIREQHTGGMKVITENFYKLLNSKLGDVKPLTEQSSSGVAQQGQSVQSTPKKVVAALATSGYSLLIPKALEYLNGSGTSDVKVQKFCQLCNTSNAPINANGNQMADSIRDAVQGVGTNEESIFKTFNRIQTFDDFCSLVKAYKDSYSTDLYTDLDDDIDAENEWVQIMRPIRDAILRQQQSKQVQQGQSTPKKAVAALSNQPVNTTTRPTPTNQPVSEALNLGREPVYNQTYETEPIAFYFEEGKTTYPSDVTKYIVNEVSRKLRSTIPTLQKFNKSNQKIPPFIELYVGTSSTGSPTTNKNVASGRMNYLRSICEQAMAIFGIRPDVAFKLITQSYTTYQPSQVDTSFYDTTKAKPINQERDCFIVIKPLETKGLTPGQVGELQGGLIDASSIINTFLVDNVDEKKIALNISKLQTYSDITDLNKALLNARKGDLETFLNDQLFDDIDEKRQVVNSLNNCAKRSSKPPVAKIMNGGDIAIML